MREFDLEAAKAGEPIVCRNGTPAKFIAHVPDAHKREQVVALVGESIELFYESGMYVERTEDSRDLCMAPKRRIVWVNFYGSTRIARYFSTEYEANQYPSWSDYDLSTSRIGNRAYPVEIEE